MKTPIRYSPTLGAIIDSDGKRLAVCESDSIGNALVLAANAVLLIESTQAPSHLIGVIGQHDMQAAAQVCRAAYAVAEASSDSGKAGNYGSHSI